MSKPNESRPDREGAVSLAVVLAALAALAVLVPADRPPVRHHRYR